jgi:hypothetical protein
MTTVAEDLYLLLHLPDTGRAVVDRTSLDRALGGALLLDLSVHNRITAEGDGARAKITVDTRSTGDALLDLALERLGPGPLRAQRGVERLARRIREPVLEGLAGRGLVERRDERWLGLFPHTTWTIVDHRPGDALRRRLAEVLLGKGDPDEHLAGLISLVHAVKAEHKLVDGNRRELRARAEEIAGGDWAGVAVRKAVQAVQASVAVAVSAAAAAGSTGSS